MTEIREPNFGLDLPGEWEPAESAEPGAFSYRGVDKGDTVVVMLLGVKPVFAIADPKRMLDDYLSHRSKYEGGQRPGLEQSDPTSEQLAQSVEGSWSGVDAPMRYRVRHRVILVGGLLADFRYDAVGLDEDAFDERAESILGSATVSAD